MFGNKLINTNAGGGCTNTVDLYNPFPDGGGVALYQLNGDATDVSGNYDGTASNVTWGGAGEFGQAASFQSTNSRIILPDNVDASLEQSVSIWVKPTLISYSFPIYFTKNGWGINVYIPSDGAVELQACRQANGTQITYFGSAGDIVANTWYNFVITRSSSQAAFYINSQQVATINYDGTRKTNNYSNTIGNFALDGYQERGLVDQVRVFNRALRPYEVEALYTEEYCTPTIVPSEHFNTVLYTGDNTSSKFIPVGFTPDLVWLKSRDTATSNALYDTVRGNNLRLVSNGTGAQDSVPNELVANGFNIIGGTGYNDSTLGNQVAWNFKAGGAAVSNTDGVTSGSVTAVTSQVSSNTDAGFSICEFTTPSSGKPSWGHGLNASPDFIILKRTDAAQDWFIYLPSVLGQKELRFTLSAATSYSQFLSVDSSKIDLGSASFNISANANYIAYCFAEVEGFSKFGSYTGGTANNSIILGFEPAFVMIKSYSGVQEYWAIYDNKRSPSNPVNDYLAANASFAENVNNANQVLNFNSNGFTLVTNNSLTNLSGSSYIYMAFAADPTAVEPTLEDSFNTVLYTGTGAVTPITGVGFQPDFTWIKGRTLGASHQLTDSVRTAPKALKTNRTDAEDSEGVASFDSDGFTLQLWPNENGDSNTSGQDYVAWNWKGAEIPAINSNGSIPSVVSANPAAGFSISNYSGKTGGGTTGHGLNLEPEFIIFKRYTAAQNWFVFAKINNVWHSFEGLNTTAAAINYSAYFSANDSIINWYNANEYNSDPASKYLAYSFHSVAGFSKFGSYSTDNSSSKTIDVGFEPAFLLLKSTNFSQNWVLVDNKRPTYELYANQSQAEAFEASIPTFTNNGFTLHNTRYNGLNDTYIYMAFANQF